VPRLSIIIPVLGSANRLETTLVSVLENRPPDCEILVVHNAPYADPYDLAGEVRFLPVASRAGLVECVNAGIEASHGSVVHMLASGLEVTEGWTQPALEHFQDPRVASVSPVVVDSLDTHVTVAAGLAYSCRRGRVVRTDKPSATGTISRAEQAPGAEVLGPLVQAAFYRRSALELLGGLQRAVGDALADIDLALALKSAGYKAVCEARSVVLAPADGTLAASPPGFRQGLASERLFWRAVPVVGWGRAIVVHPLGVLIEFLTTLPRLAAFTALAGRLLAACEIRSRRTHRQWLRHLEESTAALLRAEGGEHLRIDGPHTGHVGRPSKADSHSKALEGRRTGSATTAR
jgi:hypothetical protein